MCKHLYKDYESLQEDKQRCSLNKFIELPLDKDDLCIFHSTDLEWKYDQDFVHWLDQLKNSFIQRKEYPDFSEFHFVPEQGNPYIDYLDLLADANLQNSKLHSMISCEDQEIHGDLDFRRCTLHPVIRVSNCNFYGEIHFTSIRISDESQIPLMIFHDCTFHNTFYYVHNSGTKMNFSFFKCNLESLQMEDFSNEKEYGSFDFRECEIKILDLKNCIIHNADFTKTQFYSAEISDVSFRGETIFDHIRVESHLKFLGGEKHSIFEGVTRFDIDFKNLQGQIHFENANLSSFLKTHKDALLEFEKRENGKIEIGSGCIKYRVLSDDKVYKLKDFHQHFITEVGHSFSTFFTEYNGFNLGVEVRSKTKRDITIFYFTDDDIDKGMFIKMIADTSARILGAEPQITPEGPSQEEAVVNFQIDLVRSLTKIAYQIHKNNWQLSDSKAFFSALNLSPNIYLDEKSTHAFLEKINVNDLLQTITGLNLNVIQNGPKNIFIGTVNADKMTRTD